MKYPAEIAPQNLFSPLKTGQHIWLFLDYDGTLAEFAPNPDVILPDDELINLLHRLSRHPRLHTAIISGRRLAHICALVPLEGIWLAGTYGVEMRDPKGKRMDMLAFDTVRPVIERIKPCWEKLLEGKRDFYLEDKGWSLAIHGSRAAEQEAQHTIHQARGIARQYIEQSMLHLLGGQNFLEVCPRFASKKIAIETILQFEPLSHSVPVYLGDDDKDEIAFSALRSMGGIPILVAAQERPTEALHRLPSPCAARAWLEDLISFLG